MRRIANANNISEVKDAGASNSSHAATGKIESNSQYNNEPKMRRAGKHKFITGYLKKKVAPSKQREHQHLFQIHRPKPSLLNRHPYTLPDLLQRLYPSTSAR